VLGRGVASNSVPHEVQKAASSATTAPHAVHFRRSGVPQCAQKRAPSALSAPQAGQASPDIED
jgi:hypothetical protein